MNEIKTPDMVKKEPVFSRTVIAAIVSLSLLRMGIMAWNYTAIWLVDMGFVIFTIGYLISTLIINSLIALVVIKLYRFLKKVSNRD